MNSILIKESCIGAIHHPLETEIHFGCVHIAPLNMNFIPWDF